MIPVHAGVPQSPATPTDTSAQDADPKFSMDVNLVTVACSVRDPEGHLAFNLEQADFELQEEGEAVPIRLFRREEQLPLTLAVVQDVSGSQDPFADENEYATVLFFRRILRQQDQALYAAFGNRIRLLSGLSHDLTQLESSIKNREKNYDRAERLGPEEKRTGGSAVLDAIYWTAYQKLRNVPGRKAVIMIGDGKENASKMHITDVIDLLQKEDILFYGLDNGGDETNRETQRNRSRFPMLSEETGGRVIDLRKTKVKLAYEELEAELRTLFTLGYNSPRSQEDGRFRRIRISVRKPGYTVRARPGYFARSGEKRAN